MIFILCCLFGYLFFPLISRISTEIVLKAARRQCRLHLNVLKSYFSESLSNVKQSLNSSKPLSVINVKSELGGSEKSYESLFSEFLVQLVANVVEKIKGILQDLMVIRLTLVIILWYNLGPVLLLNLHIFLSGVFATGTDIFS